MDTVQPEAVKWRPRLIEKVRILDYLKSNEDKISWTAFTTGGFFDWALTTPGGPGCDIPSRKATIYDGGDVEWETTNLCQIGEAVSNALSPAYQAVARNQIAYINSFTATQNEVRKTLENQLGQKLQITQDTTQALRDRGAERLQKNPADYAAALDMATASILGLGAINQYSKERELWNVKLGLKKTTLEESATELLDQDGVALFNELAEG